MSLRAFVGKGVGERESRARRNGSFFSCVSLSFSLFLILSHSLPRPAPHPSSHTLILTLFCRQHAMYCWRENKALRRDRVRQEGGGEGTHKGKKGLSYFRGSADVRRMGGRGGLVQEGGGRWGVREWVGRKERFRFLALFAAAQLYFSFRIKYSAAQSEGRVVCATYPTVSFVRLGKRITHHGKWLVRACARACVGGGGVRACVCGVQKRLHEERCGRMRVCVRVRVGLVFFVCEAFRGERKDGVWGERVVVDGRVGQLIWCPLKKQRCWCHLVIVRSFGVRSVRPEAVTGRV